VDAPGSSDPAVLARAAAEGRILITFDKDFGELVFRSGLPSPAGIVLFRITPASPSRVAQVAVTVLESRTDWEGHFSVIEENRLRMTPLPSGG
jgi:predicted nuclease of predicted toxin-antitoxin system